MFPLQFFKKILSDIKTPIEDEYYVYPLFLQFFLFLPFFFQIFLVKFFI